MSACNERQQHPVNVGDDLCGDEMLATDVEGFLDGFLALAQNSAEGASACEIGVGDVADEDLAWLDHPDAFFPSPACSFDNGEPSVSQEPLLPVVTDNAGDSKECAVREAVARVGSVPCDVDDVSVVAVIIDLSKGGVNDDDCMIAATSGAAADVVSGVVGAEARAAPSCGGEPRISLKEQLRKQKVARYLAKRRRRKWTRASCSYESRQRVANARPRHKGRFMPLASEFVPIAELQRRQRALMKQMQMQQHDQQEPATWMRY